jgi:hypothetical protein
LHTERYFIALRHGLQKTAWPIISGSRQASFSTLANDRLFSITQIKNHTLSSHFNFLQRV